MSQGLAYGSKGEQSTRHVGHLGLILRFTRSLGGGHGDPLQYSCLETPHGQRSLAGYNPQGHKGSNTNEVTDLTCLSSICCPTDRQAGGYGALEDCGFLVGENSSRAQD